jgi:hypothetical protein
MFVPARDEAVQRLPYLFHGIASTRARRSSMLVLISVWISVESTYTSKVTKHVLACNFESLNSVLDFMSAARAV